MPTLWRISKYSDLSGTGGLHASARWHLAGNPVVYLADSPSTALLETLVHLEVQEETYPECYKLLEVQVPDECRILKLELPAGNAWMKDVRLTQRLGTTWLRAMTSPLAAVPSVLIDEAQNYLLNPHHPDSAQVHIVSERIQRFDPRLLRLAAH